MSTSRKGNAGEHAAKGWLERQGWWVSPRSAASKGCADLICLRPVFTRDGLPLCEAMFVQVKCNKGSPYMNFRADERAALRADAVRAGAVAALLHLERVPRRVDGQWEAREEPLLITSEFWPIPVAS